MVASMTALAAQTGGSEVGGARWIIEMRSVNAKGLDIRMRLPDHISQLEPKLRKAVQNGLARGSVNISVRVDQADDSGGMFVDERALQSALAAAMQAKQAAEMVGLETTLPSPAELLSMPGVMKRTDANEAEFPQEAFEADFDLVLKQLVQMRAAEGSALSDILQRQLAEIEGLAKEAALAAEARRPKAEQAFRDAIARIEQATDSVDEGRMVQEMAVLATKADVTEELDRLQAHVAAARALLDEDAPIGRRLDFLMQEFNREANTLCSKSGDSALTSVGLDLKAAIEQMREQVQNVE